MHQLFSFRRSLRWVALALCSASIIVIVSPASARPNHGAGRHARAYHAGHHVKHYAYRHHRHALKMSRWERGAAEMQIGGFTEANPAFMGSSGPMMSHGGFASSDTAVSPGRIGRRARLRHASRWERAAEQVQARGLGNANASLTQMASADPNATMF